MIEICQRYVRALSFAAFMTAVWSVTGNAAPLPRDFQGAWILASDEETQCKKSDQAEALHENMITVTASAIVQFESGCDFRRIGSAWNGTVEAMATCSGEGMRWRERQILSVQNLDAQKYFIYVVVNEFDLRDDGGKKVTGEPPSKPNVRVYRECK